MYKVAIDESATHGEDRMLAVGCCVATSTQWRKFVEEWYPYAKKYQERGGYHATSATDDDNGVLAGLIKRRVETGCGIRLAYKDGQRIPLEITSRWGGEYPACIRACVGTVSVWCDRAKIKWVAYVIEDGHKGVEAAKDYFRYLKSAPETERRHVLMHAWVGKENLLTHASDLIAHEWAKHLSKQESPYLSQFPHIPCVQWTPEDLNDAIKNGLDVIAQNKRAKAQRRRARRPPP